MRLFSSFAIILGAFVADVPSSVPSVAAAPSDVPSSMPSAAPDNSNCNRMILISSFDAVVSIFPEYTWFYFKIDDPSELNVDISFGWDVDFYVRHMV